MVNPSSIMWDVMEFSIRMWTGMEKNIDMNIISSQTMHIVPNKVLNEYG